MKPERVTTKHAPEGHAGDVAEFKGCVKRDDEGSSRSEHHVKIEPVAGITLACEPAPLLAEGIEIDEEKEKDAEHAELDADGAARCS